MDESAAEPVVRVGRSVGPWDLDSKDAEYVLRSPGYGSLHTAIVDSRFVHCLSAATAPHHHRLCGAESPIEACSDDRSGVVRSVRKSFWVIMLCSMDVSANA